MEDGLKDALLREVMLSQPWIGTLRPWEREPPDRLLVSWESDDGSGALRMDQPLASFSERRFGARLVRSEWVRFPEEAAFVSP